MTSSLTAADAARATLSPLFPIGSRVATDVVHVTRSGLTRYVTVCAAASDGVMVNVSALVATATRRRYSSRHDAVEVGGVGFSATFDVVYALSHALYPDGVPCTGHRYSETARDGRRVYGCASPSHVNPGADRDTYTRGKMHSRGDAGYAFRDA